MPRGPRHAPGGMIFLVLNRGVGRRTLFHTDADFLAFERVLAEALARVPGVKLLADCLMSNHWHLQLLPTADRELSEFRAALTIVGAAWRKATRRAGDKASGRLRGRAPAAAWGRCRTGVVRPTEKAKRGPGDR